MSKVEALYANKELMDKIGVYNQKADRMNELGWHLDKLNNSLDSLKAVD